MNLDGLRPWAGLAGGSPESADVVVVGIAYDGSAVYRKGAALAPQRIRSLSAGTFLERVGLANIHSLAGGIDAGRRRVGEERDTITRGRPARRRDAAPIGAQHALRMRRHVDDDEVGDVPILVVVGT